MTLVNHLTSDAGIGENTAVPPFAGAGAKSQTTMPPRAILFDFDGVIAATENHHVAAWQRTLGFLGLSISDQAASRSAEMDDRDFLREFFEGRGIPVDRIDDWVDRKRTLTVELLKYAPRVYPGVVELVSTLRDRARLAVVSGSWRECVETVLDAAGIADAFGLIITKEDVTDRKPHPEAYALALKKLRLAPTSVAAIEDSPTGLISAREAGIRRLIAVGHRRPIGDWIGDATFVEKLGPGAEVLERLGF